LVLGTPENMGKKKKKKVSRKNVAKREKREKGANAPRKKFSA